MSALARRSQLEESVNPVLANEEAEDCVLGTLLTGPEAVAELAGEIDSQDFFFQPSRIVLKAIVELEGRGTPIDNVTLSQYLIDTGQLDQVGGAAAVAKLLTRDAKSVAIARHQLGVLRELRAKRQIAKMAALLTNPSPATHVEQLLADAESMLNDAKQVALSPARQRLIEFQRPSELKAFAAPAGSILVGDCHIVRGAITVIGGPPGVGKSRSSTALTVAGATGQSWFGLHVHRRFRTLVVQNENGRHRLSMEFRDLDCSAMDDWVRVCPPPPFGLCFDRREFRRELAKCIERFQPDVVVIDPWNSVARDEHARDYLETFNAIREVIPAADNSPALVIVAHTRKPKSEERATGRGLLNLLAGSYVLGSIPRSVFIIQSATDDPQEKQVIFTCCKNNDGELGPRTAWERRNGLFREVEDFDWSSLDAQSGKLKDDLITKDDLSEVFSCGPLSKADAVRKLEDRTGAGRSSCYNALRIDGKFSSYLRPGNGVLIWTE